jgi:hypothetical protein
MQQLVGFNVALLPKWFRHFLWFFALLTDANGLSLVSIFDMEGYWAPVCSSVIALFGGAIRVQCTRVCISR